MDKNLEKYLIEAANTDRQQLPADNPYRDIGFDQKKGRLGWVRPVSFFQVKESLERVKAFLAGKKSFIFIGMGGSINGLKPLFSLFDERPFYVLDNLDPRALLELTAKIGNLKETAVISISKSGTTKETQLLSLALGEVFSKALGKGRWMRHFLWLSDVSSFEKLNSLGWAGVEKTVIQFDGKTDIGGRFSSPNTLIFFLPLFLLLNKDFSELEKIYNSFAALKPDIRKKAYSASEECKSKADAYFSPLISGGLDESFSSWIVQLFQESLGSKRDSLAVKTLTNFTEGEVFFPLRLDLEIDNPVVSLMSQMYFFQAFIACYSAQRQVNFVTQNFVEKYKQQMNKLETQGGETSSIKAADLESVIGEAKGLIQPEHQFIEIVLYFYPREEEKAAIKKAFNRKFPQSRVLIFVGSDWNHQSYQAAFGSKDTFYVLLTRSCYEAGIPPKGQLSLSEIPGGVLAKNIKTLKVIAEATYLTLKDKSLLLSLEA